MNEAKELERSRIWRKANPEKARESRCAWRKANPEKIRDYGRAWRKANREKLLARNRIWKKANPEKMRAIGRACYNANPEKTLKRNRAWYKANSKRVLERNRAWRKANPEKNAAKTSLNAARKFRAVPIWACKESIERIYAEARRLTVATGIEHHVDHVVPLKSPIVCGLHVHYNLRAIPARKNLQKGNKFTEEVNS